MSPALTAWAEIEAYNEARIDPPWPPERLRREAEKLWTRDERQNGGGSGGGGGANGGESSGGGPGDGPVPPQYSEDALALAFTRQHAATWRYVAGWGQWLTWTGSVWMREETLGAYHLARHDLSRHRRARAERQAAQPPRRRINGIGRRAPCPGRPRPCHDHRGVGPRPLGTQYARTASSTSGPARPGPTIPPSP